MNTIVALMVATAVSEHQETKTGANCFIEQKAKLTSFPPLFSVFTLFCLSKGQCVAFSGIRLEDVANSLMCHGSCDISIK